METSSDSLERLMTAALKVGQASVLILQMFIKNINRIIHTTFPHICCQCSFYFFVHRDQMTLKISMDFRTKLVCLVQIVSHLQSINGSVLKRDPNSLSVFTDRSKPCMASYSRFVAKKPRSLSVERHVTDFEQFYVALFSRKNGM